MKKLFGIIFLVPIILFFFSLKSYADTSCQPIYGGGQSCVATNNILLNKTLLNPATNQFVDNLSINDPKYQPGFVITFQIAITNISNSNISKIDVKDIFPQYVSFGSGAGTFDSNANTLSFSLTDLAPNETRKYSIVGKIPNAGQISIAYGSTVCVVNQAIATINNNNAGQDNAQFCIEKSVSPTASATPLTKGGFPILSSAPITITPATGPEVLILFSLIPACILGIYMIKSAGKRRIVK